jgi:hypothetical protein
LFGTSDRFGTSNGEWCPEYTESICRAVTRAVGYTLSSPAIADGQIFIRTDFALWAIGERSGE